MTTRPVRLLCALAVVLTAAGTALADIPHVINWQGIALDDQDHPIDNQVYLIHFGLYAVPLGGTPLWQASKSLEVEHGLINAFLGEDNPIPDTVFDGSVRYLQVQFDGDVPFARIALQSLAFAFRTESLDGATGGVIGSDIELKDLVTVPAVRLYREGTSTEILGLDGTGSGGRLQLFDGTHFPTIGQYPADSGGGTFELISIESPGGKGIVISNGSLDEPAMLALGEDSYVFFNMGLLDGGDPTVLFPTRSVADYEIGDEPGLTSMAQGGLQAAIGTSDTPIGTAVLVPPAAGYMVVMCEASMRNFLAGNYVDASLVVDGFEVAQWWWDAGDVDSPFQWADQRQTYTYVAPVSADTTIISLRARVNAGTMDVEYAKVTAMYFPTAYGSVGSLPVAPRVAVDGRQPVDPEPARDPALERERSIAFNEARMRREMDLLQKQIDAMQRTLDEVSTEQTRSQD